MTINNSLLPAQPFYQFLQIITGKRLFFIFIISFTCFQSLFAQSDSRDDKLQISLNTDWGGVISLPKPKPDNSIFYVPTIARLYYGLLINVRYKRISLETGIERFSYPVAMGVKDTAIMSGAESVFNSEFTAYRRVPFSLGYVVPLKNSNFDITPYLAGGISISASGNSNYTSYGEGGITSPTDTITTNFTHGLHRNQKNTFYGGIGVKLQYRYKKLAVSINTEYFQTFDKWGTLYGYYERHSLIKGSLLAMESFKSVDRNINFGIAVGWYLYH